MLLYGVSWKDYVLLRELLDGPSPRMTYREGVLELMSPSRDHELWKTNIARLVELYAHIRGLELYGYGGTTFKKEAKDRGCEPDECYLVGKDLVDVPDIVLEVIHTNPLLDKLDVYAGLEVPEVRGLQERRLHRLRIAGRRLQGRCAQRSSAGHRSRSHRASCRASRPSAGAPRARRDPSLDEIAARKSVAAV